MRLAPPRLAPLRSASLRLAPLRLASLRLASLRSAPLRSAPLRSAPGSDRARSRVGPRRRWRSAPDRRVALPEDRAAEVGVREVGAAEVRACKLRLHQEGSARVSVSEISAFEICPLDLGDLYICGLIPPRPPGRLRRNVVVRQVRIGLVPERMVSRSSPGSIAGAGREHHDNRHASASRLHAAR